MPSAKSPNNTTLKCQFHAHCFGDPVHPLPYTPKQLIKKAKKLDYDVLAITCHKRIVFSPALKKYAQKKGILLIPGAEIEINKKHVLIINVHKSAEKIKTFEDLRTYRASHPESLIIAPHPYFPGFNTLKKELERHIDLFDAIEHSFSYTKTKNYNLKAIKIAKKFRKPLIATSDCHLLENLDLGYAKIQSKKETNTIITAIKNNKITNFHSPTSYFTIFKMILTLTIQKITHPAYWKKR